MHRQVHAMQHDFVVIGSAEVTDLAGRGQQGVASLLARLLRPEVGYLRSRRHHIGFLKHLDRPSYLVFNAAAIASVL